MENGLEVTHIKEDKELERIRQRKFRQLIKETSEPEKERKPALNKPIDVTDVTLNDVIQRNLMVVIDCWAPWCGPCRMVAPIIEELARKYAGKILFGKLNVDENRKVATQHQIMSIPTLLVFKNGKLVDRIVGMMPRQTLEPKITKHL